MYDQQVHPKGSASVSMDARVYRVRVVEKFLRNGIPMSKIDSLRPLLDADLLIAHTSLNIYLSSTPKKRKGSKMRSMVVMFPLFLMDQPALVRH